MIFHNKTKKVNSDIKLNFMLTFLIQISHQFAKTCMFLFFNACIISNTFPFYYFHVLIDFNVTFL